MSDLQAIDQELDRAVALRQHLDAALVDLAGSLSKGVDQEHAATVQENIQKLLDILGTERLQIQRLVSRLPLEEIRPRISRLAEALASPPDTSAI